jgi:hypothetical protein
MSNIISLDEKRRERLASRFPVVPDSAGAPPSDADIVRMNEENRRRRALRAKQGK